MPKIKIGFEFEGIAYYTEETDIVKAAILLAGLTTSENSRYWGRVLTKTRSMTFKTRGIVAAEEWLYIITKLVNEEVFSFCTWLSDVNENLRYIVYTDPNSNEFDTFTSFQRTDAMTVALNYYTWRLPALYKKYKSVAASKKNFEDGYQKIDLQHIRPYMYPHIGPAGALHIELDEGNDIVYFLRGDMFVDLSVNQAKMSVALTQRIIAELAHIINCAYAANFTWKAFASIQGYLHSATPVETQFGFENVYHYGVTMAIAYSDLDSLLLAHSINNNPIPLDLDCDVTGLVTVDGHSPENLVVLNSMHPKVTTQKIAKKFATLGWNEKDGKPWIDKMYVTFGDDFVKSIRELTKTCEDTKG